MAKRKIAIVEDDIAIVQMYRMKFEAEGYEVVTAGDGELGFKLIEDLQPDIILLDVMMPLMNGNELLEKIQSKKTLASIPVIVLTNMGETEGKKLFENLRVDAFIVKADMTPTEVAAKVAEVLGK